MAVIPAISDAEWEVMKALWNLEWAPASEVVEALAKEQSWHPRTVKTLLARLVKKGAVETRSERNRYLYRAAVPREACLRHETRSFLSRVFDGDAAPALVHFLRESAPRLSADEVAELKKILEQGAGEGKGEGGGKK